jgi:hypothetical protein
MNYLRNQLVIGLLLLLVSAVAQAGVIPLTQSVYSALETLERPDSRKFENALAHLSVAREHAESAEVKGHLDQAIRALRPRLWGASRFPGEVEIATAVTAMRGALSLSRVRLNQSWPDETLLLEALIVQHLFPGSLGRVKLSLSNVDKASALNTLLTYLADPVRSVKYDPAVALLVMGRNLAAPSGNPEARSANSPSVSFIIQGDELEAESKVEALRAKKELEGVVNLQLGRDGVPIRTEIEVIDRRLLVNLRVEGFKYAPLVEAYLWNTAAWAADNRYLNAFANGLEAASLRLETAYLGGQPTLQGIARRASNTLTLMEDMIRLRMTTGQISQSMPTVEILREKLSAISKSKIASIEKSLVRLKDLGASESMIAQQTRKTAELIEKENARFAKLIQKVDEAVAKVAAAPDFAQLSEAEQAQRKLDAAKRVSKVGLSRSGTLLKAISGMVTAYYAFEWAVQAHRVVEPQQKLEVHYKYGAKVVTGLMYFVPALGEAAFALDVSSWVLEKTIQQAFVENIDLPNTENLVYGFFKLAEDFGYWQQGTTRFEVLLNNTIASLPAFGSLPSGQRVDLAWVQYQGALKRGDDPEAATKAYLEGLRRVSAAYAVAIYKLIDLTGTRSNRELGRYLETLHQELLDPSVGYLTFVGRQLGVSRN